MGEKSSSDERFRFPCGCVVVPIIGIVASLWCVLSAITNTRLWQESTDPCGVSRSPAIDDPSVRLVFLVVGLHVVDAELYSIAAMREYWSDIPWYSDFFVIVSSGAGVVLAAMLALNWALDGPLQGLVQGLGCD